MHIKIIGLVVFTLGLVGCSQSPQETIAKDPTAGLEVQPQFGTENSEFATHVLVSKNSEAVFVVGPLDQYGMVGYRYNRDGTHVWNKVLGGAPDGYISDAALDSRNNLLVTYSSEYDAALRKFSPAGDLVWRTTIPYPEDNECQEDPGYVFVRAVEIDAQNNAYVLASTFCPRSFLFKLNPQGELLWQKPLGEGTADFVLAPDGSFYGIAPNDPYTSTATVLSKFSSSAAPLWEKLILQGRYTVNELSIHGSNLYFAGSKRFSSTSSESDAFFAKANLSGNVTVLRTFGSTSIDLANALTVDANSNMYVVGTTNGNLAGPNKGTSDTFVRKYTPTGKVVWTKQYGSARTDRGYEITLRSSTELYVAGLTSGDMGAGNQGGEDGYLMRINGGGFQTWIR